MISGKEPPKPVLMLEDGKLAIEDDEDCGPGVTADGYEPAGDVSAERVKSDSVPSSSCPMSSPSSSFEPQQQQAWQERLAALRLGYETKLFLRIRFKEQLGNSDHF